MLEMRKKANEKFGFLVSVLVFLFIASGCSSIPLASKEVEQRAKQFDPEDGKAILYIVQDGGYASGMALFQVSVDGQPQGSLSGRTFHRVVVNPGVHTIFATSPENEDGVKVDAPVGGLVFVSVPSIAGWKFMRVGGMRQLSELEGKASVLDANLARGFR
ncbi:hypothetical protein [Pseudomonas sp. 65/3-MNA-CIBAN-0223]|uniref:hypothetical protein n=1 Tax=Pseudomonas sp. 65/3-MNA-CIBAN-0223 TaxID=3140476 RepID=UPI003318636A